MLTIYGVFRSRATRNIWLANELGIPFKHVPVTQPYRAHAAPIHTRSPEFLKINPNGHVPSIDDDGLVLHESLAINLYLAKKHGGPLAPASVAEDGQMTMWSIWAITEVEGKALEVMRDPKGATAAIEALKAPFAVLDAALAKSGYLVGGRFTVADINVAECVRYASGAPQLLDGAPNVKKWLAACQSRPAFKEMWAKRDAEPA
ncbi:MAG: glutathione S-transferase family protein [Hyphomicrobiaceae bacterium]|nr:glutathione S-transferase family protein [Hyphomicrobiaceae bacterium]